MDDQGFRLLVQYIRHIAQQIGQMGVDVDSWLLQSQLSQRQLDDPSFAIAYPTNAWSRTATASSATRP
jgi:hypothetical protein